MKNYYALLEITQTAPAEEIKRAFRHQIARYHPDKVQHLGSEFQEMAASRAAELTEAYRILSDANRRAEYDRLLAGAGMATEAQVPPAPAAAQPAPGAPGASSPHDASSHDAAAAHSARFSAERASRDEFVRKAVLGRLRRALDAVLGDRFDESTARGFDAAAVPKARLFARGRDPRLLVRFVPRVDGAAVADAWAAAVKWAAGAAGDVCVLLAGSAVAAERELAGAIAEQRRRPTRGVNVTLVPVDASEWTACMPKDAPPLVRALVDSLKSDR